MLSSSTMAYYVNQTATKPKGSIELQGSKVEECSHPSKKNCFSIVNRKRTFFICADDEGELKLWVATLRQQCSQYEAFEPSPPSSSSPVIPSLTRRSGSFLASSFLSAPAEDKGTANGTTFQETPRAQDN